MMKLALVGILALTVPAGATGVDGCDSIIAELRLPAKLKTRGKPKRARWEVVNQMMPRLREASQNQPCGLTFGQVFETDREELFFPVLDSVLRTAPESSLNGLEVYFLDGSLAGTFANPVAFEKTTYTQYYFQFIDKRGDLQAANRDLLDFATGTPLFLFKWKELKDKVLIASESQPSPQH